MSYHPAKKKGLTIKLKRSNIVEVILALLFCEEVFDERARKLCLEIIASLISTIRKGKYRPATPYVMLRLPSLDSETEWTGELW